MKPDFIDRTAKIIANVRIVPPDYWNEPDGRPTREDIVGQYTVAALKALNRQLDAEKLASVTPEDIEVWTLEIAAENSEE